MAERAANGEPLALDVQHAWPGTGMRYRLAYADAGQLHAYQRARWALPPAQLLARRLRDVLGQRHPVLPRPGAHAALLRVELEEFSQVFAAPGSSHAVVQLRATLLRPGTAQQPLEQWFEVRHPAATPDAAGAARALALASKEAAQQIAAWLDAPGGQ